ncbi:MAG: ABC transporter permease [Terracidiphilus sp.]
MDTLLNDIRYALRQLRKSPAFTLTAVLTLAFGIGATTAIFSIVEGVLLRPLPFADQSRLVALGDSLEGIDLGSPMPATNTPETIVYPRDTRSFLSTGAYRQTYYELSGLGVSAQINASRITASMFPTLGVSPFMGRVFTQQEDDTRQHVTVISYQMWHSRFHGDPQIIGQKIFLDRQPYQIIGVMPRDFEFPLVPGQLNLSELWVPTSLTQAEITTGQSSWNFKMIGRLKPGVTPAQAQQDAQRVAEEVMRGFPPAMASLRIRAVVAPLAEITEAGARPLVRTLFFAVAVVLFIACANLAGLLLVRVIRRRREISVRLALGASAAAVLRQSIVEALVLSISGGLVGLALASAALRVGVSFLPETLPRISAIGLDWAVVAFALGLSVLTGLVCGLIPAIAASRTAVNDALKEGGRTGTAGGGHAHLRSALVVAELAVALILLTASGLLLRSFEKLRAVDLGFRPDHVLTAAYSLPRQQYSTQAAADAFDAALLAKLQQLPGVQTVGITDILPAAGQISSTAFFPEGYVPPKGAALNSGWPSQLVGNYYAAAGIPILRGRDFNQADTATSPLVIIVNQTLAEHYWPGQDPIGKRIHVGLRETPLPWMTVVGEVGDVKQESAETATSDQFYQPVAQVKISLGMFAPANMINGNSGYIIMRSGLPPDQMTDSLRAAVRSIDPQLPLTDVESMDRVVSEGQAPRRFNTALISSFAAAAVLLSLLGIYSVIAFSAALRTQEMAIRLALGAQRTNITRLVVFSGAKLGLAGCGLGAIAAVFATRLLRSLLFQIDPLDPAVIVFAAVSIFLLALAASIIPACRAASIDPMHALRNE